MHRFLCSLMLPFCAAVAGRGEQILPLDEVRAGQRGYGLSVFSGYEPQRFEVEVLGIWRQIQPDTSYILARLSGHDLEQSGVVSGMSGSPVYLEGRLAGAVAFAWPFSLQAVAGITPIEAMQRLEPQMVAAAAAPQVGEAPSLHEVARARWSEELLAQRLAALKPSSPVGTSGGVIWGALGFGSQSQALLARTLGSVAPAGRVEDKVSSALVPGAAVAGVLIDGDLQLAATGTVTSLVEDRILAFGHPFLGVGAIELPMATAEVVTVLSSQFNSFKITNLGAVVGAFDLDRMTGVRGRLGAAAPTTPLRVAVHGDRSRVFELRLARVPLITPTLAALSVLGTLEAVTQAVGPQGLDLAARFDLAGLEPLVIQQSFDGVGAGMQAALYLLALTDYLLNNRLQEVELSGLQVELAQHPQPRLARLVEAHASKTLVQPGDSLSLNLDLVEYRGERRRRTLEVAIPSSIPDGRYSLLLGDGVTLDVARLAIERTAPVSFGQALKFLRSLHSRRQLVVLGVYRGQGLAVAGEVLPRLPASVRSLWEAASSSTAVPLQLAIAQQHEIDLEVPLEGAVRIDLEVRRQGPLVPEATGEAEPDAESPGVGGEAAGGPGAPAANVDPKEGSK